MTDPYATLGVSSSASAAEIKALTDSWSSSTIPMREGMTSACWLSTRPGRFWAMPIAVAPSIADTQQSPADTGDQNLRRAGSRARAGLRRMWRCRMAQAGLCPDRPAAQGGDQSVSGQLKALSADPYDDA